MGEKIFKGGVVIFLLLFLFVAYAVVGGINDRTEVQGDRITAVEGDVKGIKKTLEGVATKEGVTKDIAKVVQDDAIEDGRRIAVHEHGPLHAKPVVVRHRSTPRAVRAVDTPVRQVAVAEPKLVLPRVGDPCPYGVVYIDIDAGGAQHVRCGPVQQVAVQQAVPPVRLVEAPAPRDDFYDRVQYVPQRRAPDPTPLPQQPAQAPVHEASSGSSWTPWIVGAGIAGLLWYVNAHRGGNTLPVGLGPTAVTNGVGVNPVGGVGGAPTVITQ